MTLITWQGGGPVFKDGQVGTEQACCCGGEGDCSGACSTSDDCSTGCLCVFTGSRQAFPPTQPDPYTPDFEGQTGTCCKGAAIYEVELDGGSFAGWTLLSHDCPDGYAPPTSAQVIDCEPALPSCVNCCTKNEFP